MNDKKEENQRDKNNSSIEDIIIPTECPICDIPHDEEALSTRKCGGCDEPIKAVTKVNDAEKESKSNDINTCEVWLCSICETTNENTDNCLNCKSWKCKVISCYYINRKGSKNCVQCEKRENYINENAIVSEKNEDERENFVGNEKRFDSDELESYDYEEVNILDSNEYDRTNELDNHEISSISDHDNKWKCTKCNYANDVSFVICDNCSLTWRCTQCTCINETNRNSCKACGKLNEAGIESQKNNNKLEVIQSWKNNEKVEEAVCNTDYWTCKMCTFKNKLTDILCEACGESWYCKSCTCVNDDMDSQICEACEKSSIIKIEENQIKNYWKCCGSEQYEALCSNCKLKWFCFKCRRIAGNIKSICKVCKCWICSKCYFSNNKNDNNCSVCGVVRNNDRINVTLEQQDNMFTTQFVKENIFNTRKSYNHEKDDNIENVNAASNDNETNEKFIPKLNQNTGIGISNRLVHKPVLYSRPTNSQNTNVNKQSTLTRCRSSQNTTVKSGKKCWFELCPSTKFDEEDFCVECNLKYYEGGKYDELVLHKKKKEVIVCSKCYKKRAPNLKHCKCKKQNKK